MLRLSSRLAIPFLLMSSMAGAQERQPFHVTHFSDDQTISLTIVASVASADVAYDYDVRIGLTEHATSGEAIFVDNGAHIVRVRCQAPRMVLAGSSAYILRDPPQVGDWKEDLWKTLCLQPIS